MTSHIRIVTNAEMATLHGIPGSDTHPFGLALGDDVIDLCDSQEDADTRLAKAHRHAANAERVLAEGGDFYDAFHVDDAKPEHDLPATPAEVNARALDLIAKLLRESDWRPLPTRDGGLVRDIARIVALTDREVGA